MITQAQAQTQDPGQSQAPCAAVAALARHLNLPLAPGTDSAAGTGCCAWPGISCTLDNVKAIAWPRQSLQGNLTSLPLPLQSASPLAASLELLDLAGNPLLVGSIPSLGALSHLTALRSLSLASTGISGPIPPNSLPPNLIALDLSSTSLSGPIPPFPKSISACALTSSTANYTCYPSASSFPSACRNSLPASLPECPKPGPFDNFQWTSDVIILIAASITVTLALITMIVVCYRWDRARDQATVEKDQLLGELRRIRVQQASALGVDPALEALGPQMARAAMKRSSMASSTAAAAEGSSATPSTPGAATPSDPRLSFIGEQQAGMRVSYDPYDPRWSYPSTPGSQCYDPHAPPPHVQRASYVSSTYAAAASPSTALWPHSDATPPPGAPTGMGGGIRQSWPVYPPASSSSASAASSPAPLLAAHPNASSTSAAAISHPPPPPPSPVTDLAATPATHPLVAAPADHHKRHSLLSVFRTALSAAKWTTRRKSAPPATPVLVTTEPLKLDHHPDPESRPESWVGNRSILPPSVIEYRALDSMEHANLDMDLGMGDDQDSAQAPPASLVAQYPRSEAAAATARSQFVASASSSPPALGDSLLMSGGAGTRAAAGDQASSVLRWLPSADHRLSVSAAQSQVETEGGVGYVGVPMRQNSGGESVSQTPHVTSLSPLVGNAVPGRLEMGDVVTLADVRGGRDAR